MKRATAPLLATVLAAILCLGTAGSTNAAEPARPAKAQQGTAAGNVGTSTAPTRHSDPEGDRMTDALNLLFANDYTGISNLTPVGTAYSATAYHGGRQVNIVVDPATGRIEEHN
jgi:hypothetical protein